jgi:hypothetical protein
MRINLFSQSSALKKSTADQWLRIVIQYSTLHLTQRSDILPALSGIATSYAQHMPGGYLAGIWKDDLARGLLWCIGPVNRPQNPENRYGRRASPYRAPTWSWASIDAFTNLEDDSKELVPASVSYQDAKSGALYFVLDKDFRVLDAKCTAKTENNVYGEVIAGVLRVEGKAFTPLWCKSSWLNIEGSHLPNCQRPVTCELGFLPIGIPAPSSHLHRFHSLEIDLDVVGDADIGVEEPSQLDASDLRCLIITNDKDADLRFLLLQRVCQEKNTFERLAEGRITKWGYDDWMVREFLSQAVVSTFLIV